MKNRYFELFILILFKMFKFTFKKALYFIKSLFILPALFLDITPQMLKNRSMNELKQEYLNDLNKIYSHSKTIPLISLSNHFHHLQSNSKNFQSHLFTYPYFLCLTCNYLFLHDLY